MLFAYFILFLLVFALFDSGLSGLLMMVGVFAAVGAFFSFIFILFGAIELIEVFLWCVGTLVGCGALAVFLDQHGL